MIQNGYCEPVVMQLKRIEKKEVKTFPSDKIIRAVSNQTNIPSYILKGKCKKREYTEARCMAFYLLRKHTDLKLSAIGSFYRRHYSTVIHGIIIHEQLIETDKAYKSTFSQVVNELSRKSDTQ